jgi:hypothetical protein
MHKPLAAAIVLTLVSVIAYGAGSPETYSDLTGVFGESGVSGTGLTSFPTLTIPFGGEYEGMGTAYTAVLRDSSYFDANPSGSSTLEHSELSFLHNNWIADTNVEGIVYTMRFEHLGIGIGTKFLHVPFTAYNSWGQTPVTDSNAARGRYSETVLGLNGSYNFFSSYEYYGLAVGGTLKLAYRNIPEALYSFKYPNLGSQSAIGVMLDLGLHTRFNFLKFYPSRSRNFSVGLSLKNFGPAVGGDPLPGVITAGLAYSPLRPLLFSFDFNLPYVLSLGLPENASGITAEPVGFAFGTSVQITNFFGLLSGFQLKGGNPRISVGGNLDLETVSFIINYTLDMTTQIGQLDRISLQAILNFGDLGRAERRALVDEYYFQALEHFAKGEYTQTVAYCKKALEIDPDFTPARETIETAKRTSRLQTQIESFQEN